MGTCKQNRVARFQGGKPQNHSGCPGPRQSTHNEKAAFLQINRLRARVYRAEAEAIAGGDMRRTGKARQKTSRREVPAEFPGPRAMQSGKNPPFSGAYASKTALPGAEAAAISQEIKSFPLATLLKKRFCCFSTNLRFRTTRTQAVKKPQENRAGGNPFVLLSSPTAG